jgi:hypothetical protein
MKTVICDKMESRAGNGVAGIAGASALDIIDSAATGNCTFRDKFTLGPAHGQGSYAFSQGVLMPNGKVCLVPYISQYIGIYDPVTNTYANGPLVDNYYFLSGVLLPNGKVLMMPQSGDALGIYDPVANSYSRLGWLSVSFIFHSMVSMATGNVLIIPYRPQASNPVCVFSIYNYTQDSIEQGPVFFSPDYMFAGGVPLPDGKVCLIMTQPRGIVIYDPVAGTQVETAMPSMPSVNSSFNGGVLMSNGKVCLIPNNSEYVGIYDPAANMYANGPAHGQGGHAFVGGCLMPDGRVLMAPNYSASFGVYDPVANSYSATPIPTMAAPRFSTCVALPDGRVCLSPADSANIGIYHSGGSSPLADCLHPHYNKF